MFEATWVPSAAMAKVLGIHPQTLRKLRRHLIAQVDSERFFVADPCHQRVIAEPTMPPVPHQPKTVLQS